MSETVPLRRVLIWTQTSPVDQIEQLIHLGVGLSIVAIGGVSRVELAPVAERYEAVFVDDFRQMILDHASGDYLMVLTLQGVGKDELALARAKGMRVILPQPMLKQSVVDMTDPQAASIASPSLVLPGLRGTEAWQWAMSRVAALRPIESMALTVLSAHGDQAFLTLLYEAVELLLSLKGMPDRVDMTWTGPLVEMPDRFDGLSGHLTGHMRFRDGRSATVQLSDRAAGWYRQMMLLGRMGHMMVMPHQAFMVEHETNCCTQWTDDPVLEAAPDPTQRHSRREWGYQMAHLMTKASMLPIVDREDVLATSRAMLWSAKTGAPESPHRLRSLDIDEETI